MWSKWAKPKYGPGDIVNNGKVNGYVNAVCIDQKSNVSYFSPSWDGGIEEDKLREGSFIQAPRGKNYGSH